MTNEQKEKVIQALTDLKGETDLFIKIYFMDQENYTIKFIDKQGNKVHTMRKAKNKQVKGFDNGWWKGQENGKS